MQNTFFLRGRKSLPPGLPEYKAKYHINWKEAEGMLSALARRHKWTEVKIYASYDGERYLIPDIEVTFLNKRGELHCYYCNRFGQPTQNLISIVKYLEQLHKLTLFDVRMQVYGQDNTLAQDTYRKPPHP